MMKTMKINTDSWHYKIQYRNYINPEDNNNLCAYMRGLILALATELMAIVIIPIFLITSPFIFLYSFFNEYLYDNETWRLLFGLSIIGTIIDIVIILNKIKIWTNMIEPFLHMLTTKEQNIEEKKDKKPNIFIEWIKAKKQKICPIIEFVE